MAALTVSTIDVVCAELLQRERRVTVRQVRAELARRFGTGGRTERVAARLRWVEAKTALPSPSDPRASAGDELQAVRAELQRTHARAIQSEERERAHQDYWAARYADKVAELESRHAVLPSKGIPADRYLRLYQVAAELAARLARYEAVDSLAGYLQAAKSEQKQ